MDHDVAAQAEVPEQVEAGQARAADVGFMDRT